MKATLWTENHLPKSSTNKSTKVINKSFDKKVSLPSKVTQESIIDVKADNSSKVNYSACQLESDSIKHTLQGLYASQNLEEVLEKESLQQNQKHHKRRK